MALHLNGVPINARTVLLALIVLGGVAICADMGYRWLSDGATDMTLRELPRSDEVADELQAYPGTDER